MFPDPQYTNEEHKIVFDLMDYLAKELLSKGVSVVYDANFNFRKSRDKLKRLASETHSQYFILKIETPEEIAQKRSASRHTKAKEAEKDIFRPISKEIWHQLKDEMEELKADEPVIALDGTREFKVQIRSFESQL